MVPYDVVLYGASSPPFDAPRSISLFNARTTIILRPSSDGCLSHQQPVASLSLSLPGKCSCTVLSAGLALKVSPANAGRKRTSSQARNVLSYHTAGLLLPLNTVAIYNAQETSWNVLTLAFYYAAYLTSLVARTVLYRVSPVHQLLRYSGPFWRKT